jgi:hypothetical protein
MQQRVPIRITSQLSTPIILSAIPVILSAIPVILSVAKDLFASPLVPRATSHACHPEHIRCAQCKLREGSGALHKLFTQAWDAARCHPERSEGSGAVGTEMLRYVQYIRGVSRAVSHTCHPERSEGSVLK